MEATPAAVVVDLLLFFLADDDTLLPPSATSPYAEAFFIAGFDDLTPPYEDDDKQPRMIHCDVDEFALRLVSSPPAPFTPLSVVEAQRVPAKSPM